MDVLQNDRFPKNACGFHSPMYSIHPYPPQTPGIAFEFKEALVGGAAIDATGVPLPDATLDACRDSDAVLLAAIGG